ncbi:MAG: TIR domain-containing protein [Gemmatimonadaceae bacterium]
MPRIPVFYSFHYDNDVFRVQQVRNMGVVEGDEPVSPNDWEQLKRSGDRAVERWIDENMKYKRCVIVLVGSQTANRKWVRYEIKHAYDTGKALFGIYIHNLKCPRAGTCGRGPNPFDNFTIGNGSRSLSSVVPCHDPGIYAYGGISENLSGWVDDAVAAAKYR